MTQFYKIENDYPIISPILLDGFAEYTVGAEPQELQVALQAVEIETLKQTFKSMYLATVDAKLKAMDYDSLATVKLWADDATFGTEATRILTWYKAIIAMNYKLLNDVGAGIVPMPTEVEYQAMIDAVVF